MRKIRKGDQVVVTTGRDKGKVGKVVSVLDNSKILVDGVNIVRKHQRPVPLRGITGGIIDKPAAIHVSNVALWNPETNGAGKVGFRLQADGSKVRYFKSTNQIVGG